MTTMAWAYVAYLIVCIGITVWVAGTLRKHGLVFLTQGRDNDRELSDALSHLLIVGFYLVTLGVISFVLKSERLVGDVQSAIELLSAKVGTILVALGAMHFLIVAVFSKVRRTADERRFDDDHRHALSDLAATRQRATH